MSKKKTTKQSGKPASRSASSKRGAAARSGAAKARKPAAKRAAPVSRPAAAPAPKPSGAPGRGVRPGLKKSEITRYRDLLTDKLEALVGDLKSMEKQAFRASEQDSSANHMADYGTDNYEQDFTLGLIENEQGIVREIHAALQRIDAGSFGACEECSVTIPAPRLEVLPWARFCVECQSRSEKL